MSIITPEVYSYKDIDPYVVYGEAVVSSGLEVRQAINGAGLTTRGLIWQLYDIWIDTEYYAPLVTSWANSEASVTTTWTSSEANVTTTWADVQYGVWGEFTP